MQGGLGDRFLITGNYTSTSTQASRWNTLGAVMGVLGAEIFLIDRVGVLGTAWVAATLDLGVAAGALALAHTRSTSNVDRIAIQSTSDVERIPIGRQTALLAAAFLAGTAFLILEVLWFRFLTMYVLATTLAASMMLASVLAAIGVGGLDDEI